MFSKKILPRVKVSDDALLGKKGHSVWIELLIFLLVFAIASTIEGTLTLIPTVVAMVSDSAIADLAMQFVAGEIGMTEYVDGIMKISARVIEKIMLPSLFATAVVIVTGFVYCTKIEKRPLRSLGFRRQNAVPEYLVGLLLGTGLFAAAVGVCAASGSIEITAVSLSSASWIIVLYFVGYMIQGMSEEVLCRGYLMVSIARRAPVGVAIAASSIVFGLLHLANPGFTFLAFINIVLFGAFAGVYFYKRGSIWGIAAIHSAWNFTQGNVFGISVSGTGETPSLLAAAINEKALWNGGSFGLEGGLGVTVVLSAALLVMLFLVSTKKSELSDGVPAQTVEEPTV